MASSPYRPAPEAPPAARWPLAADRVTSGDELPGYRVVRTLGVVYGTAVRGPALLTARATPERAIEGAWREALAALARCVARLEGHGIVGLRFETSRVPGGASVIFLAYGTAVWLEPRR